MKLLVLIDHYHVDMFSQDKAGKYSFNFKNSEISRNIKKIYTSPRKGINIKDHDVDMYVYHKKIPKGSFVNKSEIEKDNEDLKNYLLKSKPDIIASYGSMVNTQLQKMYNINISEYELQQIEVSEDYKPYVSINSSLGGINIQGFDAEDRFIIENHIINRFLSGGIDNTKPKFGKYKLITDFDDIKGIFERVIPRYPIVALDFETNTTKTYLDGAKAIMFSASWSEHQGISIPIEHELYPDLWSQDQLSYIINHIKELFKSKQHKVLHNGIFDITMLMNIYHLPYATNCIDSLIMYYVGKQEMPKAKKGLKHLAYKYTDMGGYENDRDVFFDNYKEQHYKDWESKEIKRLELEEEAKYKKTGKHTKVKVIKSKYTPPINPVDGKPLNFEWIPIDILYKYAAADTDVTLQLYNKFSKSIKSNPRWTKLIYNFYPKLIDTLAFISSTGLHTDWDKFEDYSHSLDILQDESVERMYQVTPEISKYEKHNLDLLRQRNEIKAIKPVDRTKEQQKFFKEVAKLQGNEKDGSPKYKFRPSSKKNINYILYHELGYELPLEKEYFPPKALNKGLLSHPEKITWEDYKADKDSALPYIWETYKDPFAKELINYAKITKLKSSVIGSYPSSMDSNHYLHSNFVPTGTPTSRLSSVDPNIQNIVKPTMDTDNKLYKYPIKGLFTSRFDNGMIINIDYKSLEIFVAALVSKDISLMQPLMDGADIHRKNASIAFGIKPEEVSEKQRFAAKSVN